MLKSKPLKRTLLSLLLGGLLLFSCKKEKLTPSPSSEAALPACIPQLDNPTGRSYPADSVIAISCTDNHCGLLPLGGRNYWIYEDSVFNDGVFVKVKYDTLRYVFSWKSLSDGLVWWQGNVSVGLPDRLYSNDSAIFLIANRLFMPGIIDTKKEYSVFPGDSMKYLTSFEDNAAQGRSVRLNGSIATPAGSFEDCILFEKNARNFRKDQVFFKPGLGVIKYIHEKAPMGSRIIKLQQVSTLISYHIE